MIDTLRPSRWWALRLVTAVVACVFAVLASASPASAHATLVSTDPVDGAVLDTSPGRARFTFDERVALPADAIRVFDATGAPVDSSASASGQVVTVDLPDTLAEGTYVVAWRIVSADGHPVAGSLTFSVGTPSLRVVSPPPPRAAGSSVTTSLAVVNGVTYIGLLLTVGLGIFLLLLLPAEAKADRPRQRARRLMTIGTICAGVAAVAGLPLTAVNQLGLGLGDLVSSDVWAGVTTTAVAAVAAVVIGLLLVRLAVACRREADRPRMLLAAGGGLAVFAPALTGHSRGFEPQLPVIAVDVLHVLAGSVWLGGLAGLALALPVISGRGDHGARTLERFSTVAASVLAALVVTGGLLGWRIVSTWGNLFGTGYGQLLLVKIGLVAVAASIAAWNRFVLLPKARDARGHDTQRAESVRMSRVVSVEAGILLLVLALTGFLVNESPRAEAVSVADGQTGVQTARLGGEVKVLALMAPARVGQNTILIQLQDLTGEPLEPGRLPTVSLRSEALELGEVTATSDAAGTYRAEVVIPAAGTWRLQVSLPLSDFENPVGVLEFAVAD